MNQKKREVEQGACAVVLSVCAVGLIVAMVAAIVCEMMKGTTV